MHTASMGETTGTSSDSPVLPTTAGEDVSLLLRQCWLCLRVLLCKACDAVQNGAGREPPRLCGASDTAQLLRCVCGRAACVGECVRRTCHRHLEVDGGWMLVRPSPSVCRAAQERRARMNLLRMAWRDARMLLGSGPTRLMDGLWVGSSFDACNEKWLLRTASITGIVNVTVEVPNFMADRGVEYLNWVVRDEKGAQITLEALENAARFIDRHRRRSTARAGGALVHCFVGRSRSVAVCCYYLITRKKQSLYEAYRYICAERPITQINTRFLSVLQRAEQLRGRRPTINEEHQKIQQKSARYSKV